MEKCLSIITNFGCHYTCPYCIVKENNLKIKKTTMSGLDNLKYQIEKHHANILSISGGGDPLHDYNLHSAWYDKLFDIVYGKIPIELHTSYLDLQKAPYDKFQRVVYHCRTVDDIARIKRYGNQAVRIVYVVDKTFSIEKINAIYNYNQSLENPYELTFREMVDSNYKTTHYCSRYLDNEHMKKWWYIKQNDYNLYYVENEVYTKFEDFKEREE